MDIQYTLTCSFSQARHTGARVVRFLGIAFVYNHSTVGHEGFYRTIGHRTAIYPIINLMRVLDV